MKAAQSSRWIQRRIEAWPQSCDQECPFPANRESDRRDIGDVLPDEPPQITFVECDHMIEKLTAATADPAFRDPVLPRRLHACALRRQPYGPKELNHVGIEFRVAVDNYVAVRDRIENVSRSCCTTHSDVGLEVTLK